MLQALRLDEVLSGLEDDSGRQQEMFALLTLGVVELLVDGRLDAVEATRRYFNAENGLYVRKRFLDKVADKIMSHGVQLQDLFEVLPQDEAPQEFERELLEIRSLCLQLIAKRELVA